MTGFLFLMFGLGGVCLSLIWFNVLWLCIKKDKKRRKIARHSISNCFRLFIFASKIFGVYDCQVHGIRILLQDRGCLMLANHPTLLDYVILASLIPDLDCVVKADLLKNPFVKGAIKAADYLINDEDPHVFMQRCKMRLERGDVILIFPEGTRTRRNLPVKLQRGAANIALRCQSDMRLIKITCVPLVVPKEEHWYQAPLTKPIFKIEAQDMIRAAQFFSQEPSDEQMHFSVAARRLTDYLTEIFARFKIDNFGSSSHDRPCSGS